MTQGRSALTTSSGPAVGEANAGRSFGPADRSSPTPPARRRRGLPPEVGSLRPDDLGCGPTATHTARTSASMASASAVRAARGSPPSRLLPFAPRKGTTSDGIGPDTTAPVWACDGALRRRRSRASVRPIRAGRTSARREGPRRPAGSVCSAKNTWLDGSQQIATESRSTVSFTPRPRKLLAEREVLELKLRGELHQLRPFWAGTRAHSGYPIGAEAAISCTLQRPSATAGLRPRPGRPGSESRRRADAAEAAALASISAQRRRNCPSASGRWSSSKRSGCAHPGPSPCRDRPWQRSHRRGRYRRCPGARATRGGSIAASQATTSSTAPPPRRRRMRAVPGRRRRGAAPRRSAPRRFPHSRSPAASSSGLRSSASRLRYSRSPAASPSKTSVPLRSSAARSRAARPPGRRGRRRRSCLPALELVDLGRSISAGTPFSSPTGRRPRRGAVTAWSLDVRGDRTCRMCRIRSHRQVDESLESSAKEMISSINSRMRAREARGSSRSGRRSRPVKSWWKEAELEERADPLRRLRAWSA